MKSRTQKKAEKEALILTKFGSFLCIFEPNYPEMGFTVTSPAAQGFITYGSTLSAAKKMAREGLEFHYECTVLEHCAPRQTMEYAGR